MQEFYMTVIVLEMSFHWIQLLYKWIS